MRNMHLPESMNVRFQTTIFFLFNYLGVDLELISNLVYSKSRIVGLGVFPNHKIHKKTAMPSVSRKYCWNRFLTLINQLQPLIDSRKRQQITETHNNSPSNGSLSFFHSFFRKCHQLTEDAISYQKMLVIIENNMH